MAKKDHVYLSKDYQNWKWREDQPTNSIFIYMLLQSDEEEFLITSAEEIAGIIGLTVEQAEQAFRNLEETGDITREPHGDDQQIIRLHNNGLYKR